MRGTPPSLTQVIQFKNVSASIVPWPNADFLTNHARVLACIAQDPEVRLRHIASKLNITERRAFTIVNDLILSGYVVKEKEGRRNRYKTQVDAPIDGAFGRGQTISERLKLLVGSSANRRQRQGVGELRA